MITTDNLKQVLEYLEFTSNGEIYTKKFKSFDCLLKVDFQKSEIIYPENKGLKINERQTCNFSSNENFVVLECVYRLLKQGYNPAHIELEPKWKVGHGASGGRADILVRDNEGKSLLIIECKNAGTEFTKHWNGTLENGSQLFGYAQQERDATFLCLYASDFIDGKVKPNYCLITLKDNEQYLEDNPNFESFKDAKIREDLYQVWKNTYQKDFTTKGLFETDIQAYNIGKKKYSIADLSVVDSSTKQSKHHDFATVLRKYNVSGRENAFDKLVNLFLCKIVDEKNNPNDLQFYWKGIAYDTPFELQDRLQKLYQTGMNEFLKEDVTYIDNNQIDKAFWAFKNDPDATRETIKSYFKQLKFFTNNDFAFIDVHNERLFYENAEVLIEIVRLFQDTKIKSDSKDQFLGDMFENFLDGGVKQSEGQFFTPMPITCFIIQSLPLESIIRDSQQIPKAIDYACGSGHFLNELASQMLPFIKASKEVSLEEYHKAIRGIEKEYRLSKVAKVSAFMYGQDHIEIAYADSLAKNNKFNSNDYQILVANPPYSVKGFLGTLDQESKDSFELIKTLDNKQIPTNNSIECFFIEKAKQMLASNGVAAIIVPSSILSNGDSTYIETRSILLKYFNIVAIAEFGSGTFGKTGTNTVTLFLRRKGNQPEQAAHYLNRVHAWFNNDAKKQEIFADEHFIQSYCRHIKIDFTDYKTLLDGKPIEDLLKTEMFTEYAATFNQITSIKNKKKQRSFANLTQEEQQKELNDLFINYVIDIEKEKLYYFVLASQNPTHVVIVKAPSDNQANKKFLGYEWSSAKGSEGIKLNTDTNGKHLTPLYDKNNRDNSNKINYFINKAFNNKTLEIPEELTEFVSTSPLVNMLNFTRTDFSKQISLTPNKNSSIESKWKLVKIKDICDLGRGRVISKEYLEENTGIYPVYSSQTVNNGEFGRINSYDFEGEYVTWTTDGENAGTCFYHNEKFNCTNVCGTLKAKNANILMPFLSDILNMVTDNYVVKVANPKLMNNVMAEIKIPLPPKDIQQKIVDECQAIDTEKEKAELEIEKAKENIESLVADAFEKGKQEKLKDLFHINTNSEDPTNTPEKEFIYIDIDSVGKGTGEINYINKIIGSKAPSRARRIAKKGDVIISSVRPYLKGFALINQDVNNCIFSTGFFILNTKDESKISNKAIYYAFMCLQSLMTQMESKMGKGQYPSINKTDIENFTITYDSKVGINNIKQIEVQEKLIDKANKVIETIVERKQAVLKEYL